MQGQSPLKIELICDFWQAELIETISVCKPMVCEHIRRMLLHDILGFKGEELLLKELTTIGVIH